MPERLSFTLTGRDELSRVLNQTGDASDRLRLRMAGITADADGRLRDLQGNLLSTDEAARRLDRTAAGTRTSFNSLSEAGSKLGESLRANLISLAPAAIPAAAGLAGSAAAVAAQFGAVALAAGAYALALGPQMAAIGEAVAAQDRYEEAVRTSGRTSQEAVKAQLAYQQQLESMPPATREAAVAVGFLKDNFREWSDSLAGDVMGPFNKGVAVANELLPETTGLVKGASGQFDRLITMVGGAIESPGFDRLNNRVTDFADRTLDHAVDQLTVFLAKLDSGQFDGGGLEEFFDYARANGPLVWETLENVGDALLHVLEAGSGVGVGMLEVINALSGVVSAVPPDAIATFLQLAIAIKAVKLAAVGTDAARAAVAALGLQVAAMRTAAAGAPGPLTRTTAAIGALSRGAKLAMVGTGLGLLLLTLGQLGDAGRDSAPDVDKLATSLRHLADSGKFTGELKKTFGDMDGLISKVKQLQTETDKANETAFGFRIPVLDDTADWIAGKINDISKGSESLKSLKGDFDSLDKGLASLVQNGYGSEAAKNFGEISAAMKAAGYSTKTINGLFGEYRDAAAGQRLETELAAASMGLFGQQAQEVQAELELQKRSTDGLRESVQALNDVHRKGLSGMLGFEAAIDAASAAAKENAGVLDMQNGKLTLNTEKQRTAAGALNDLAAKTDEATAAARDSGASWSEVSDIYERGRQQLIANAMQMGLNRNEAKALADQILKTPDKTAFLKGDVKDLREKIAEAKDWLKKAPSSKTAAIKGNIKDLQTKLGIAQLKINGLYGRTVTVGVRVAGIAAAQAAIAALGGIPAMPRAQGGLISRAQGGPIPGFPGGGLLRGAGTPTSDSILLWGSTGEYMVKAASVDKYGLKFMDALNSGELPVGRPAPRPGLPASPMTATAATPGSDRPAVVNNYTFNVRKSVISAEDVRLIQRQEEARQRVGRAR
ncbi:hypothetical protein [Streptomyces phaeochromogenes]